MSGHDQQHERLFIRDITIVSLWLLFLAILNQKTEFVVVSIFPYLAPVAFITWRYGLAWGFLLSAIASLAAMPGDYMNSHDMKALYWAGLTTYLKLTAASTGIVLGRHRANQRKNK